MTLIARTRALSEPVDLLRVAGATGWLIEHDGVGLAGRGEALRVELPSGLSELSERDLVSDVLATIESQDEVGVAGSGPVAMGSLPFDPDEPASLTVPSLVVGRARDGRQWVTTIGLEPEQLELAPPDIPAPDEFSLRSIPHERWKAMVDQAVAEIRAGRLDKVVLAREVRVQTNRPIVVQGVLERLRSLYPSCAVFSFDGFVGATPELLVSRRGSQVRSHPLAGTQSRTGESSADARAATSMLKDTKQLMEHRMVVEAVETVLRGYCDSLSVPAQPSVMPLRNVMHLGTMLRGQLREGAPSSIVLAAALHPTPAVAGSPTDAAMELIKKVEGFDRDRYAGPVGWLDAAGNGEWFLGIRSAEIEEDSARLFAGVGVVADSDSHAELVETQLKLQALLAALVRP